MSFALEEQLATNLYYDRTFDCEAAKILPGEYYYTQKPMLIVTVLGSCVAVCLWDPIAKIGGMNHFLLPFGQGSGADRPLRYGIFAIESLVNALMKAGAQRSRLEAKVFGGARITANRRDIGRINAAFAKEFLATEGIALVGESLGGCNARRVVFRPTTGQARLLIVPSTAVAVDPPLSAAKSAGQTEIELF